MLTYEMRSSENCELRRSTLEGATVHTVHSVRATVCVRGGNEANYHKMKNKRLARQMRNTFRCSAT